MRISTGIKNLDNIMRGGFLERSFNLICGTRGTGKTIFTLNYLINGAERGEDVLYVSLEESWRDVVSNLPKNIKSRFQKVKEKFHYLDFGSLRPLLGKEILTDTVLTEVIESSVKVHKVSLVGFDGIGPLASIYNNKDVRNAIFEIAQNLRRWGVTTVFTSEEADEKISRYGVEEYIADSTIRVRYDGRKRRIQVLKMRGSDFIGGEHGFKISDYGINVYPRVISSNIVPKIKVESIGIKGLDEILGGGIHTGDMTLIVGPPGTGKTIIGLQFLKESTSHNEEAVFISFESYPNTLRKMAKEMAVPLEKCRIIHRNPIEIDLYEFMWEMHTLMKNTKRLILDGIDGLRRDEEYIEFIHAFFGYLKNRGITTLITYNIPEIISSYNLGEEHLSYLADNIINLRYSEIGGQLEKILIVIKSRLSMHEKGLIGYRIGRRGILISGKVEMLEGVMSGLPRRVEVKKRVEKFFK